MPFGGDPEGGSLFIVAVAGAFASLVVLLILCPILPRCRHSRPLPPIQPLAYHRAKTAALLTHPSLRSQSSLSSLSSSQSTLVSASTNWQPRLTLSSASIGSSATNPSPSLPRGVPHGPHSRVQIVLPAPLAPSFNPYGNVSKPSLERVDKWILAGRSRGDRPWSPHAFLAYH